MVSNGSHNATTRKAVTSPTNAELDVLSVRFTREQYKVSVFSLFVFSLHITLVLVSYLL